MRGQSRLLEIGAKLNNNANTAELALELHPEGRTSPRQRMDPTMGHYLRTTTTRDNSGGVSEHQRYRSASYDSNIRHLSEGENLTTFNSIFLEAVQKNNKSSHKITYFWH